MAIVYLTSEDVGKFLVDQHGEVWQCVAYCAEPTASVALVRDPDVRRGGMCGAPIFEGLRRLVPKEE